MPEKLEGNTFDFDVFPVPADHRGRSSCVTLKRIIGGGHVSDVYEADAGWYERKPVAVKLYKEGHKSVAESQIINMKSLFEAAERIRVKKLAVPKLLGYREPIPGISVADKRFAVVMELLDHNKYFPARKIKDKVAGGVVPLVDIIDAAVIFLDTIRVMHEADISWYFSDRKPENDVLMAFTPSGFDVSITDWDVQVRPGTIRDNVYTDEKEADAAKAIRALGGLLEVMVVPSGHLYTRKNKYTQLTQVYADEYLNKGGISPSTIIDSADTNGKGINPTGTDQKEQYKKILSDGTSLILEHQGRGGMAIGELVRKMAQGDSNDGGDVLSLEVAKAEFLQTAVTIMNQGQKLFGEKSNDDLQSIYNIVNRVIVDYWKSEEGVASKYNNYWKGHRLPKKIPYSIPENFPREYAKGFIQDGDLSSLYRLHAQLVMEIWRRRDGIDGHIDYKVAYKKALDDALQKHQWTSQELEEEWKREQESEQPRSVKFKGISNRLLYDLIDYSHENKNKPAD